MTTKELLLNHINNAGSESRDKLRELGKLILNRDSATVDRKLRELSNKKEIIPIEKNGFIVAYIANRIELNDNIDNLDNILIYIKSKIKANWDTYAQLKEINEAINSKNIHNKKYIINKYTNIS